LVAQLERISTEGAERAQLSKFPVHEPEYRPVARVSGPLGSNDARVNERARNAPELWVHAPQHADAYGPRRVCFVCAQHILGKQPLGEPLSWPQEWLDKPETRVRYRDARPYLPEAPDDNALKCKMLKERCTFHRPGMGQMRTYAVGCLYRAYLGTKDLPHYCRDIEVSKPRGIDGHTPAAWTPAEVDAETKSEAEAEARAEAETQAEQEAKILAAVESEVKADMEAGKWTSVEDWASAHNKAETQTQTQECVQTAMFDS
jgi:hypothetical protein